MRISWIDRWRGFLIISIVMFHVVGIGIASGDGCIVQALEKIKTLISTYHVVSFFVIAAILLPDANIPFGSFLAKKAKRLLIPYFVFGVAMVVVFHLSTRFIGGLEYYSNLNNEVEWYTPLLALVHGGGWPDGVGNRVIGPLWFLPCFFSAQVFFYFIAKVCDTSLKWFSAAVLVLVLRLFSVHLAYGVNPFGIEMAMLYLVFMCISRGAIATAGFDLARNDIMSPRYIILAVVCLFIGSLLGTIALPPLASVIRFVVVGSLGVIGSALIAKTVNIKFLAYVGRYSLGVFVVHKFFLVAVQAVTGNLGCCFDNGLVIGLSSIALITTFVVAASIVASKVVLKIAPWAMGERCNKRSIPRSREI